MRKTHLHGLAGGVHLEPAGDELHAALGQPVQVVLNRARKHIDDLYRG